MQLLIYIPLIICLLGLLIYHISNEGKVMDTGRLMFIIGLSGVVAQIVLGVKP